MTQGTQEYRGKELTYDERRVLAQALKAFYQTVDWFMVHDPRIREWIKDMEYNICSNEEQVKVLKDYVQGRSTVETLYIELSCDVLPTTLSYGDCSLIGDEYLYGVAGKNKDTLSAGRCASGCAVCDEVKESMAGVRYGNPSNETAPVEHTDVLKGVTGASLSSLEELSTTINSVAQSVNYGPGKIPYYELY